jgi:hypothetical protein
MAGAEGSSTAAEMEVDLELSRGGEGPSFEFEFAFNSQNFSDRLLRIEVVASEDAGGRSLPEPDSSRHEEKGAYVEAARPCCLTR